ncbi:MAG TPA: SBBP repeat-containing protein, partial [Polyangiaceae bacterium]|nr:SBBP repeat-containing protein [Polyangiaceae bacterium]
SYDEATGIAADSAGNTYFVGYTASTLFPTYSPEQPTHSGGAYDAFVVKLDATGQNRIYATYLGGSGPDMAYAVATDAFGDAYVAGLTASNNFPVVGAVQATLGGAQDAFVTKLNPSGSALLYSTYLGGALDDYARGIAVSGAGAAYLVGTTFSANFPRVAALQSSLSGTYDAFVAQLAPGVTGLVYSTYLGGSGTEYGNAIALDTSGSAYVVGSTTSSNFPILNARQSAHAGGSNDAFLCKLNLTGSGLVFSTYLGGSGTDEANGVTVTLGTAVVVGSTLSTNFPLALAKQPVPGGNNHTDAFVTRFDASGTSLIYSTYLGGTGNESATAVASDPFGDAYLVGSTDSSDLPVENPIAGQETYRGGVDAFVSAITPTGSRFVYTSYLGGTTEDRAAGVAFNAGTTQIVGNTRSTDFPKVTPIINGLVGAQDAFVVKIPGVEPAGAPALGNRWFALGAGVLLLIAMLFVNGRQSADCRNAR